MQAKFSQFLRSVPKGKAVLLAVLLLVCAAFATGCWWMKLTAENNVRIAQDKLAAQQTLTMPYVRLLEREKSLTALLSRKPSLPLPATINDLMASLSQVAKDAGLPGARFIPDGVSVVGSRTMKFTVSADGTSENFRNFLLYLSDQTWVTEVNSVEVTSGRPLHNLSMRFKATCQSFQNGKGSAK